MEIIKNNLQDLNIAAEYSHLSRLFWLKYDVVIHNMIAVFLTLLIMWLTATVLLWLIRLNHRLQTSSVFLEVIPPPSTEIAAFSTTQFFVLIANLISHTSFIDRILSRTTSCSCEIVSDKESGIRYLLHIPDTIASPLEKSLRSYLPGLFVKRTDDYLPKQSKGKIVEFKFLNHFSLPIQEHQDLQKHDPLAYLTSNMTQLKQSEILAVQIVLEPLNSLSHFRSRQKIADIRSKISSGRYTEHLESRCAVYGLSFALGIFETLIRTAMIPFLILAEFLTGTYPKIEKLPKTPITATPAAMENEALVKSKLEQTLLRGTIRVLLITDDKEMKARKQGLLASFSSFLHPCGQALVPVKSIFEKLIQPVRFWQYRTRLNGTPLILSASEVAALYHFPFSAETENNELTRVRSRELPAPLSLRKSDPMFDISVGVNRYGNTNVSIGLTLKQRQKHMYIIGKTGMGKTTLLTSAIYQDMRNGKGLAVFDPHGDMLQDILKIVPENRKEDVIVFNPSDREWPIGLNLLSPGVHFADKEDEQEWITSSVIAVFAKITAKEYWGPRMEHILRNATLTALQTPNPSLYTLQRLLTDKHYQKEVAGSLKDPVLKQFWRKEFALLGKMQLSSVTAPLTHRLGSFITTKMSRYILLQEKSTISISRIMDEGKILLVNLSKGDLGEDMSFFFGTVLTSFIWMAAYQRTKIPEKDRRDFFLYVDEFQNFATPRFSEITSEGRKFHVSLIASHQNIAQIEDQSILKIVAGNANTIVCLKASPDDENFILPFMAPEVQKGDIVNLPPYRFFMKTTNDVSENAFSGQTIPLDITGSDENKVAVIDSSRQRNATPRKEVEEYLEQLFSGRLGGRPRAEKAVKKRPAKTRKLGI